MTVPSGDVEQMGGGKLAPGIPGGAQRKSTWKRPTLRTIDIEGTASGTFLTKNHDEGPVYIPES